MRIQTQSYPDWYWLWYLCEPWVLVELYLVRQIPEIQTESYLDWYWQWYYWWTLYLDWYWTKRICWSRAFTTCLLCVVLKLTVTLVFRKSKILSKKTSNDDEKCKNFSFSCDTPHENSKSNFFAEIEFINFALWRQLGVIFDMKRVFTTNSNFLFLYISLEPNFNTVRSYNLSLKYQRF